jgi:uncharacterized protein involved in type VI secretion and phage assembly
MSSPTINWAAKGNEPKRPTTTGIHVGFVTNNCDLLHQGKVLVRIPSLDQEVWARLSAPGGGSGTGYFHPPNLDDEVMIALDQNEPGNSFVLGGVWGTSATPPSDSPSPIPTQRVIKSGLTAALGHSIVFDDLAQSITITTSLQHKIVMDETSIKLSTVGGTVSLTLDLASQSVSITAPASISLTSQAEIKLQAATISIMGTGQVTIQGGMVMIN